MEPREPKNVLKTLVGLLWKELQKVSLRVPRSGQRQGFLRKARLGTKPTGLGPWKCPPGCPPEAFGVPDGVPGDLPGTPKGHPALRCPSGVPRAWRVSPRCPSLRDHPGSPVVFAGDTRGTPVPAGVPRTSRASQRCPPERDHCGSPVGSAGDTRGTPVPAGVPGASPLVKSPCPHLFRYPRPSAGPSAGPSVRCVPVSPLRSPYTFPLLVPSACAEYAHANTPSEDPRESDNECSVHNHVYMTTVRTRSFLRMKWDYVARVAGATATIV